METGDHVERGRLDGRSEDMDDVLVAPGTAVLNKTVSEGCVRKGLSILYPFTVLILFVIQ